MAVVSLLPTTASASAKSFEDRSYNKNYCRIEVVEEGSLLPVPLVELKTTHLQRFITDSQGLIALDEPELMGREIWFDVIGYGYSVARDGFGYSGVRLTPDYGKTLRIVVKRDILAQRLGRLTGAGIFGESRKLGEASLPPEGDVFGCDSIQIATHNNRQFYLWGDTTLAHYPLGIFDASAATTELQPLRSFEPPLHINYKYFRNDKGKIRGVAPISGSGPTWLSGLVSLPDVNGLTRLCAMYAKIKPPLEPYELGLCVWNEGAELFERLKIIWTKSDGTPKPPPMPDGHAALQGSYLYFGNPLPTLRCAATYEAWQNQDAWEVITPQKEIATADGNTSVTPHSGSIAWNNYKKRWVTVFMQKYGKPSAFGEIWYAEADEPTGRWRNAVKILSHSNYTFYNPRLHPEITPPDAPFLLFEGTFTQTFADKPVPVPRYDYNQLLYRLDLTIV